MRRGLHSQGQNVVALCVDALVALGGIQCVRDPGSLLVC